MAKQTSTVKKHRMTLTEEELEALANRLVPISPNDYTIREFATLRNLYGRICHILLRSKGAFK